MLEALQDTVADRETGEYLDDDGHVLGQVILHRLRAAIRAASPIVEIV